MTIQEGSRPAATTNDSNELSQFQNASAFSKQLLATLPSPPKVSETQTTGNAVIDSSAILGDSGRTYHGYEAGKYFLPNDATEQERLDFQHVTLTRLLGGRLYLAPITQRPSHVLDVATGTGIWAVDFAKQFPACQVIGTDLSLIQPSNPDAKNVQFCRQDAEKDWDFHGQKFDLTHFRGTFTCFDDPKRVIELAFNDLKPGGWIEFQDSIFIPGCVEGSVEGTFFKEWCDRCIAGARVLRNRDVMITPYLKGWMREIGFTEVEEQKYLLPLNAWPEDPSMKVIGQRMSKIFLDGLRGMGWKMLQATGLALDEIEILTDNVKEEIRDTRNKLYFTVYVVFGQKPLV